ncbi:hypothetical protein F3Y22_tig00014213pilonHSYRG00103 [Hibiscus syriacus]|uniref:Uncharacterized protein n=1 Tax=Hibiscus syriacus TaxID=106335 RepID=A0A6A3BZP1_HIBSY|nr:hypothetical protein F3Y22_tig00014213pilonHSYRG00103 [Hibiscus syriacus]
MRARLERERKVNLRVIQSLIASRFAATEMEEQIRRIRQEMELQFQDNILDDLWVRDCLFEVENDPRIRNILGLNRARITFLANSFGTLSISRFLRHSKLPMFVGTSCISGLALFQVSPSKKSNQAASLVVRAGKDVEGMEEETLIPVQELRFLSLPKYAMHTALKNTAIDPYALVGVDIEMINMINLMWTALQLLTEVIAQPCPLKTSFPLVERSPPMDIPYVDRIGRLFYIEALGPFLEINVANYEHKQGKIACKILQH